jgi:CubicO group peptidase (beta-lactamase class C family)
MPALLLALLLVLAPLTAIAQAISLGDCGAPAAAEEGWQVAAPAAVGLDAATLCGIGPRFKAWTAAKIDAVLVIRHGKLVYEQYFADYGNPFFGTVTFDPTRKHDLHSITKSITALVLGIEIGKGRIAGIDQPVLPQLPDYADLRSPEKDRITLRHLLTMSQGLAWNEGGIPVSNPVNSAVQMNQATDPVRFVLAQPVEVPPGMVFNYSAGSATVIAALLRKATGQTVDTLARTDLFEPLGITDVQWDYFRSGDPMADRGLEMHPRDLAKIGQLVLDHGIWQGKQVVPADWIAAATAPQINGPGAYFYGYQFWLGRSLLHGREIDWAAGYGSSGQRLYIVPTLDLVVLVHAGLNDSATSKEWSALLSILNQYVLEAVNAP